MVRCASCGSVVQEGKFCEKCGKALVAASEGTGVESVSMTQSQNNNFFDKIGKGIGDVAKNLTAIKSNFNNNIVIYHVPKIPNVKEKKILVDNSEVLFFNDGTGYNKYNATIITESESFTCFYIRNLTQISNVLNFNVKPYVKKLTEEDLINVKLTYDMSVEVTDIDKFFYSFIEKKQDSWTKVDINSFLSVSLNSIINDIVVEKLKNEGGYDLKNGLNQVKSYDKDIENKIDEEISKYAFKLTNFGLTNVQTNIEEINKILIDNLYKSEG